MNFSFALFLIIFLLTRCLTRREIVAHREKAVTLPLKDLPHLHDCMCFQVKYQLISEGHLPCLVLAAFRALVEENVKANVQKIANSSVIRDVRSRITSLSVFID